MVQEREDIVLLDSAIILNPEVWVASGHVGGFSDPLVDCRTCKLRFRADHLEHERLRQAAVEAPRRDARLRPDRAARVQPDVRDVRRPGARRRARARSCGRRRRRASSSTSRTSPRRCASSRRSASRRSARASATRSRPGNFLFRMREFEQMEMEFFVPPAEAERVVRVLDRRAAALVPRPRPARDAPARPRRTTPTSSRTTRAATSDLEYLFPIGWLGARGDREPRRLRPAPHAEHSGTKLEWIGHEERYVPHVIEPAARRRPRRARVPRRRLRRGGGRRPAAHGAAPPSAPRAGEGGGAAADRQGHGDGRAGARALRGAAQVDVRPSTTTPPRSASATAARTRSARRGR